MLIRDGARVIYDEAKKYAIANRANGEIIIVVTEADAHGNGS